MIHQYQNNGYNIVMDVNSGSVHVVEPVVYDAIALLAEEMPELEKPEKLSGEAKERVSRALKERYGANEIAEALEDVQELIDLEQLFTRDIYKDFVMDFKKRKTVVKALCLHIAHDCNLACRYCFAEEGEYHGRRALMSYEVGKKALDFLIANSGNRRNLEVDFFGGEPLLNWDVVKRLVEYGRSQEEAYNKKFRFTLTTNGVLLNDEVMEFCNREMGNVVLSLDGRKEINDKMRPFRGGQGSYDLIVPSSRNLPRAEIRTTTMSGAHLPGKTWISPKMCFTTRIWALSRCPWSRWWRTRRSHTPSVKRTFPGFLRNTISWRWNISSARRKAEALISSIL